MRPDVIDLREFYASRLGQWARLQIRRRVREFWPDVKNERVLGLGYATPFLNPLRAEAERVVAIMPATQGVMRWPREGRNLVALAHEHELPLPDAMVDRVLLVHALENAEQIGPLLREIWRVMTSSGRLLIVVPNRRGLWARLEGTPFGHGRPYSFGQLTRVLRDNLYQPGARAAVLYVPPFHSPLMLRSAAVWERVGQRLGPTLAGVLMLEADKQIYAATALEARPRRRAFPVVVTPTRQVGTRSPRLPAG